MTNEQLIAKINEEIDFLENRIKWWSISDDDAECSDNGGLIDDAEERVDKLRTLVQNLEAGEPQVHCENCSYYCEKGEDGGNHCTCYPVRVGWYDTWTRIFCKHFEQKQEQ